MTLSFAYICKSIADYRKALHELGEDDRKAKVMVLRINSLLFRFLDLTLGNLIGTGIVTCYHSLKKIYFLLIKPYNFMSWVRKDLKWSFVI